MPVRLPRRVGPGGRTTEFPPNDWSPVEAARRLVDEPVEWLYVFDPQGRQIARFRGTAEHVDLSDDLKVRSEGMYGDSVLRNYLVVHNHPPTDAVSSFPPSPSDVSFAVERDLRELLIVSGGASYSVRRPGGYWPTDEHHLHEVIADIDGTLGLEDDVLAETPFGIVRRFSTVLQRLAQEGWIDYEFSLSAG